MNGRAREQQPAVDGERLHGAAPRSVRTHARSAGRHSHRLVGRRRRQRVVARAGERPHAVGVPLHPRRAPPSRASSSRTSRSRPRTRRRRQPPTTSAYTAASEPPAFDPARASARRCPGSVRRACSSRCAASPPPRAAASAAALWYSAAAAAAAASAARSTRAAAVPPPPSPPPSAGPPGSARGAPPLPRARRRGVHCTSWAATAAWRGRGATPATRGCAARRPRPSAVSFTFSARSRRQRVRLSQLHLEPAALSAGVPGVPGSSIGGGAVLGDGSADSGVMRHPAASTGRDRARRAARGVVLRHHHRLLLMLHPSHLRLQPLQFVGAAAAAAAGRRRREALGRAAERWVAYTWKRPASRVPPEGRFAQPEARLEE